MNLITETSLKALIHKATDVRNQEIDQNSADAFCAIVKQIPDFAYVASKLVISRLQSPLEWEAVQALVFLDTCMEKCGPSFIAEVGKFRFLNEIIKLVSPKYLGPKTAPSVREMAINLLRSWTCTHPKETKIKEAYDMLKKQGVVVETQKTPEVKPCTSKNNLILDLEFENRLKKLLNSRNAEDLEAANRMIKSRVMETERRLTDLEKIRTNIKLLTEMVNNCQPEEMLAEDYQLMDEVYNECDKLRPLVSRLAGETQDGDVLNDIVSLSEELSSVLDKYTRVKKGLPVATAPPKTHSRLLDLSSPTSPEPVLQPSAALPLDDLLGGANVDLDLPIITTPMPVVKPVTDVPADDLGLIFANLSVNHNTNPTVPLIRQSSPPPPADISTKQKALRELDFLGESLMQQCKNDIESKSHENLEIKTETTDDELMDLAEDMKLPDGESILEFVDEEVPNGGDKLVKEEPIPERKDEPEIQVRPLTDVSVQLEKITPSDVQPLRVLESANGVSILVHLAKDTPRDDVSVYVITTTSKSSLPLSDYLFQVVVPKKCKFKLQPPSGTSLPAHNPFLPPSAITQIMLIANPHRLKLHLTFMLSFTMEDETVTEVGEIAELPTLNK